MIEKLELKHLAGYLPYRLKVKWFRKDDNSFQTSDLTISDYSFLTKQLFKPILHPLSDLTKPCLEGGKIPIVELAKIIGLDDEKYKLSSNDDSYGVAFNCENDDDNDKLEVFAYSDQIGFGYHVRPSGTFHLVGHQLELFEFMYKNHFDIHGLIESGLAIDINNLKTRNHEN